MKIFDYDRLLKLAPFSDINWRYHCYDAYLFSGETTGNQHRTVCRRRLLEPAVPVPMRYNSYAYV